MPKSTALKTLLAALIAHVFWGFSFLASRTALDTAHIFTLLSHRFLIAFLCMNALVLLRLVRLNLRGKRIRYLLLLGLAEPVIYFFGEQYGLIHSNTIFSGVMIAMIPIVSTLAAAPILGERPTAPQLVFGLVSVGGVIGIGLCTKDSGALDWIGVVGLVVAVLSAVVYTLLGRGLSKEFSPFERTYVMIAVGAIAFTACALIREKGDFGAYAAPLIVPSYLLSVLFLAICCSVICYFCSGYAITHLSVARETVFANLTTAVSVFAGAFFLHEPFSLLEGVLCLAILGGICGVQLSAKRENSKPGENGFEPS